MIIHKEMSDLLSKIVEKPYTTNNGEPAKEDEKVFDISNLKPEEIFNILDFMENKVYDIYKPETPEFFFIKFRTKYVVDAAGLYEIHPVNIEANNLIFHGFKNPEGSDEVKITIPYTTMYPKGFNVKIVTIHHLMEEFFQEILKSETLTLSVKTKETV